MRHLVLGTAGHIDHGKTALVRALTGVDTDRLPEEKRRGITIDLGFARLPLAAAEFAVVDVPGHESLVRNMLAGATGIDVVLLVIAADEGPMPQTREHLAIMTLLDVRHAVVAVTKADLVEPEWLELVCDDVRGALADTPFAASPVVPVSALDGRGLDQLRGALDAAAAQAQPRLLEDLFRLPVDRVFTIRGTGTVVTGTIWSGQVRLEDSLRALPGEHALRVRGLQRHGAAAPAAGAGERVALALAGERQELTRGSVLVSDPAWSEASILTVALDVLPDAPPLRARQRVHVHLGTAEVLGRVALPGAEALAPGTRGWAQLRLERPLVARTGDRFVLRSYSPVHTIAGGIVLEPAAPKRKRLDAATLAALEGLLAGRNGAAAAVALAGPAGLPRARLPLHTGLPPGPAPGDVYAAGDRLFPHPLAAAARSAVLGAVDAAHAARPLDEGASREELRRAAGALPPVLVDAVCRDLVGEGVLATRGASFARAGFEPRLSPDQARSAAALLAALAAAGTAAPRLDELPEDLRQAPDLARVAKRLTEEGRLVALGPEHYAEPRAVAAAAALLRSQFTEQQALTPGMLREALGLTRKYLIPLLEHFDRTGVTRRVGDDRYLLGALQPVSGERA